MRPDTSRRRATAVAAFLFLWMVAIGTRLVQLQTSQHESLSARARAQQQDAIETSPARGLILDRTGRELARSVEAVSLFAVPGELEDGAAALLAPLVGADAEELTARLARAREAKRKFVWMARKLDASQAERVAALGLRGLYALKEPKRHYPNGALAAHVLGFVDPDGAGLAGVEQFQNAALAGEGGRLVIDRDARRRAYQSLEFAPRPGQTVVLTIDQSVQYWTERALNAAVAGARARAGTAIVLDPRTGEILALANAPAFDPHEAGRSAAAVRANEALENIYEPGSTFKVVAFSAAIEEQLARPDERIDCQMGAITVAGRKIRDHAPFPVLSLTEALAKSSNVAAIKLGLRVGDARMYDYIRRFGFGRRTGVELPGETAGLVRPVERWQASSIGSVAIGQEVGVTPLQMAAAFAALANDGVRVAPHLVREVRGADGASVRRAADDASRVVSAKTARTIRHMLESVTIKGTAKAARVEGYTAAGKTGTAQKIDPRTRAYSLTKHVASFVGFAPVENPSVVIVVVIDEPSGAYHGGDVAAPVFRQIAESVLPYLNVVPDAEIAPAADELIARESSGRDVSPAADAEESGGPPAHLPEAARPSGRVDAEIIYAAAGERALLMPDLGGRSVRDAARICAQLGLELEARGEGRVVRQSPAAGASVEVGQRVRAEFARGD